MRTVLLERVVSYFIPVSQHCKLKKRLNLTVHNKAEDDGSDPNRGEVFDIPY